MSEATGVKVRELSLEESEELLSRHQVGRLAYTLRNHVDIVPIHYVYDDGWIYVRSAMGQKLMSVFRSPWVAFEVDEVENISSWMSVVVHGSVQVLDPEGPEVEVKALQKAIKALRRLNPQALRPGDTSPERNFVLRIAADRISGRASSPSP